MNHQEIEEKYRLETKVQHNDPLRSSFNALARESFGIDFEAWYQKGYWTQRYCAYCLVDHETVVANASANLIPFMVDDERKLGVQIGTVMTHKDHRGQGLSRYLIEKILGEFEKEADFIYLFANDEVLEFYPRFGFVKAKEFQISYVRNHDHTLDVENMRDSEHHLRPIESDTIEDQEKDITSSDAVKESLSFDKYDMSLKKNEDRFFRAVVGTRPHSRLQMMNNPALIMFYTTSFMSNMIYYETKEQIYIIMEHEGDQLVIHDVFGKKAIDWQGILASLIKDDTREILFQFTPIGCQLSGEWQEKKVELMEDNTTLFMLKDSGEWLAKKHLRFPGLSHA